MSDFPFLWLIAPLCAFVLVLLLVPPLRAFSLRMGHADQPGGRKQHEGVVPPIGGLVIFPVVMIVVWLAGFADMATHWPLYAALFILLVTGAVDDRFHVNAWIKFVVQFGAAILIVLPGGAVLSHLGNLFGGDLFELGPFAIVFSIVAVVLFINAVNLMDGLDGLAGGIGFVVLFWLGLACVMAGRLEDFAALPVVMAVLAGFLVYNLRHPWRERASVFLGDAGSLCLGLTIAWFTIHIAMRGGSESSPGPIMEPISTAWVLGLLIFDECAQFLRRVSEGRHPFSPDRGHFHYHFIDAGFSVRRAVYVILLIVFLMGGIGYFGVRLGVPQAVLTWVWIGLLFTHMGISYKTERYVGIIRMFLGKGA